MQVTTLVDSGATSTFIDIAVVKENTLLQHELATPFNVINMDGTSNKAGQIKYCIRTQMHIGSHKSNNNILVTDLGSKQMILGMTFLRKHNPEVDWKAGEMKFTRCPDYCTSTEHINVTQEEMMDLELLSQGGLTGDTELNNIRYSDPQNPLHNWIDLDEGNPDYE